MAFRLRSFKFDNVFKKIESAGTVVSNSQAASETGVTSIEGVLSDNTLANITTLENLGSIIVDEITLDSQTIKNNTDGHNLILEATGSGVVQVNDTLTAQNITVSGNLTVNGTTTTISSTNTNVADALLLLSHGTTGSPTKDSGFIIERGNSLNVGLLWDESTDQFVAITTSDDATTVGDVAITAYADLQLANVKVSDIRYANGTSIIDTVNSTIDADISTANVNLKGYSDATFQTQSLATTANTNVVGYVDNAVSTANVNLKGYVDGEITTVNSTITTANTNMKGYVDAEITSIGAHYSNTDVLAYLTTNSYTTETYVNTANTNVVGYVDSAVSTANVNLKGYADATFLQSTLTADIDADNAYTVINLVDPTSAQDAVTLSYLESALSSEVTNIISDDTSVAITDDGVNPGYIELTVDNTVRANITTGLYVTGNITSSNYFIGNGSQLTGLPANYGNTEVATYLPTYSGNLGAVSTTANIITNQYFIGNGALLTGVVTSGGGGTYTADTSAPGSPSSGDFWYNTSTDIIYQYIDDGTSSYWVDRSSESRYIDQTYNDAVYSGNVTATRFIGDGSQLTGLPESYSNAQVTSHLLTYTGNITAGNITVSGTMTAGSIVETSTMRIKENINPIINGLDAILNLKGVTYDRLDNHKHEAGLIAEQVNKVLPDLVAKDADGNPSAIQYTKLTAYLIEAIKELNAEIEKLKGKR